MHIVLTVCSGLILVGCIFVLLRAQHEADTAIDCAHQANTTATKLASERARVTVLERELDALRRELRKLSGKFYATLRALEDSETLADEGSDRLGYGDGNPDQRHIPLAAAAPCDNWTTAQREGPHSKAATCECLYCMTQRADRARARRELVPKGAQATAATAKLNSGQP